MPPRNSSLTFRTLAQDDLAGAVRLSTQAGWNQLAADWSRLMDIWPWTCIGGFTEGLVATGTLATFLTGSESLVGWIGMILVDEACRGSGHGTAMMRKLLDTARDWELAGVGLDATDMGRPVYEKLGFLPHSVVNRWAGAGSPAAPRRQGGIEVRPLEAKDWPAVAELDLHGTGAVRVPLLVLLAAEPAARGMVAVDQGRIVAFGLDRAGRTARSIGPVVAESPAAAAAVFSELLADPGGSPFIIDVPEGASLEAAARDAGLALSRRLTRMLLPLDGSPAALVSPLVHAVAGFELG